MRASREAVYAALLASLVAGACDSGERSVGGGREQVAVHAVLALGQHAQTILVERTLTGAAAPAVGAYDADDPIVSAGGLPISGARVIVFGPGSDSAIAREDLATRGDGRGAGVYRFFNANSDVAEDDALPLTPGGTFHLRIETPDGRTVTGTTTIPDATPVVGAPDFERFNRDHDSLFVFWPEAPLAARYAVRIETPHGPFETYVDSAEYLVSGALRHTDVEGLPRVFVPGFRQRLVVAAVDANYFDYYRSESSPYTGRGLIMHLQGGVGVFGSWIPLVSRAPVVTADIDNAIEGSYLPFTAPSDAPRQFTLYLDAIEGVTGRLSGSWVRTPSTPTAGLLGSIHGDRLTLTFLADQTRADTVFTIDGRLVGTTVEGTLRGSGARVSYQQQ